MISTVHTFVERPIFQRPLQGSPAAFLLAPPQLIITPNVLGLRLPQAISALASVSLQGVFTGYVQSSVYAVNTVCSQSPSGGVVLGFGSSVLLQFSSGLYTPGGPIVLEISDNLNGSINLAWGTPTPVPDSYNVYVNGVLFQNVTVPKIVVTGLQQATQSGGVPTPPQTYDLKVVAVIGGVEVGPQANRVVTPSPTSVSLVTPMKRLWPFPNTGLD